MKKSNLVILVTMLLVAALAFGCAAPAPAAPEAAAEPAAPAAPAAEAEPAKEEAPAEADEKFVIGFSNWDDTDLFCKLESDMFAEIVKADGRFEIKQMDAQSNVETQLGQIDTFIAEGVDAIVFIPIDTSGCVPAVEAANAAGIPIICLCTKVNDGKFTFVGSNNVDAGKLQGAYLAEKLPENANVVWLSGVLGLDTETDRYNGFKEGLLDARPDVTLLASQTANFSRTDGMAVMEDWIQSFGDKIDAVAACNDQMALGAMEALISAGMTDVYITGVDATEDACNAMLAGTFSGSSLQNAKKQTEEALKVITDLLIDGVEAPESVIVPFEFVTADNAQDYLDNYYN